MAMFRLALLLGKTVNELDITTTEFNYWVAFLKLEPPEAAANHRTAALMAQITNMAGRSLKDKSTVEADDFLGGPKVQTAAEQIAIMRTMGKPDG